MTLGLQSSDGEDVENITDDFDLILRKIQIIYSIVSTDIEPDQKPPPIEIMNQLPTKVEVIPSCYSRALSVKKARQILDKSARSNTQRVE